MEDHQRCNQDQTSSETSASLCQFATSVSFLFFSSAFPHPAVFTAAFFLRPSFQSVSPCLHPISPHAYFPHLSNGALYFSTPI